MIEYELPEVSGNTINGLGERQVRRPRHVYHSHPDDLEWNDLFSRRSGRDTTQIERCLMRCYWQFQYRNGPVAAERSPITDPARLTAQVKAKARELGAELVGVTSTRPEWVFQDHTAPGRFFISLGVRMEMTELEKAPELAAQEEVLRVYAVVARIAGDLARHIRALGYPAIAHPGPSSGDILQIPAAIEAGLAQLGKHGSLISDELGAAFRLAGVTTDLPLVVDAPRDIGVDDFCRSCQLCTEKCPPQAIFPEKQWVRGVLKWYVDFDTCAPYFTETDGCAICLSVCPWSKPGVAPKLSAKMLKQHVGKQGTDARPAARPLRVSRPRSFTETPVASGGTVAGDGPRSGIETDG
ncbi:MAG: 4Fe-4S dicluster domain-containing protein [Candidatus Tectomicrobia bacterium]|nr:4Fe-4S dicluster domain-containing protein [Candidatus Tectomicrobia bacterium]